MYKILGLLLILSFAALRHSLPLSTSSRWIVSEHTGGRVKLTCVNWAAHLEPMLAEGLNKRPVGNITRHVAHMGFNCVRLTWATYMFTRFPNVTVAQSLRRLGLQDAAKGMAQNNPGFLNLTVVDAHETVVKELAREGLMVVLDNHVSQPLWCCSDRDGNGFFGDKYFDAKEWLQGLAIVAKRYKHIPMVVGMSMRNELRGPLQNATLWYRYIKKGARTIHRANPKLLVIVSGLHYDLSFTYLKEKSLKINFKNKLVYEVHRYAFTAGQRKLWSNQPFTRACQGITAGIHEHAGFLVEGENAAPLFVSEFGIKQEGMSLDERLFLGCFLGYLAEMDLDWSVWALQGSYYLKRGLHGPDETYGMLNVNWSSVRNPEFPRRLHLIQPQFQDPNSVGPKYHILYHPWSGRCVGVDDLVVHVSDCWGFSRWNFKGTGNPIQLMGTELCLSVGGNGIPVRLSLDCSGSQSRWGLSNSSFQLANRDEDGEYLCLAWDLNTSSRLFTRKCMCLEKDDYSLNCKESPHSQWFKLLPANAQ